MFWSVPATLFFEAFRAAGNDEATPWSVMAMARWPQRAAVATASPVFVRASIMDIVV